MWESFACFAACKPLVLLPEAVDPISRLTETWKGIASATAFAASLAPALVVSLKTCPCSSLNAKQTFLVRNTSELWG